MKKQREVLIEKALEYLLEHGLAELSLRPLAGKIGTSARLLVYHFGSKDNLVATVMSEVQAQIQHSFSASKGSPLMRPGIGIMRDFWDWTIHPVNIRYMRLLFEVQILAIQNPAKYARYLENISSSWLELIEGILPPSKDNRAIATLCVSIIDGLLLEYLSTGDLQRTTEALEFFSRLMSGRVQDVRLARAAQMEGKKLGSKSRAKVRK
jgi:AcrR family transcriptional regulator